MTVNTVNHVTANKQANVIYVPLAGLIWGSPG